LFYYKKWKERKMILKNLGIFGWTEDDENLALASILTGDPLLLIGNHGCAKTYLANRIAEALRKKFLVYDASKAMFEDVLGYPNVEKLKQGIVEYIPSKITVWDKEFILIDELNRAIPELQSKWLELIRSRKIMGYETKVKWVWSAMNPMTYSATQTLDEALIGRFAIFLYPPDVLQMKEEDRIKITMSINGDDAPGIAEWTQDRTNGKSISIKDISEIGKKMSAMLKRAARYFNHLKEEMLTLSEFLAKFASLLMRETKQEISLDGRRLGFIYRNILAARSVELAKSEIFGRMGEIVNKFYEFSKVPQVRVNELAKNPFELETFSADLDPQLDAQDENLELDPQMVWQQQIRQKAKNMRLLSIMQSELGDCCVIDGIKLCEGDSIKGFKVIKIDINDSLVKLESNGVEIILKLIK